MFNFLNKKNVYKIIQTLICVMVFDFNGTVLILRR